MKKKRPISTLILGIGNILLSDEGVGVRVIEHLKEHPLPKTVELVDGGTAGADLIDTLSDRQHVIIIDAANAADAADIAAQAGGDAQLEEMMSPGIKTPCHCTI